MDAGSPETDADRYPDHSDWRCRGGDRRQGPWLRYRFGPDALCDGEAWRADLLLQPAERRHRSRPAHWRHDRRRPDLPHFDQHRGLDVTALSAGRDPAGRRHGPPTRRSHALWRLQAGAPLGLERYRQPDRARHAAADQDRRTVRITP